MLITESLLDSHSLLLTGNTETVYTIDWLDTKDGPLVVVVPPQVLGMVNDFWGRYVCDLGRAGPDKGQGGKYLLLPPGYTGEVPAGYFVVRSRTYGNWLFFRGFLVGGDPEPAVENTKQHYRVYPLASEANPPAMTFVNISGAEFNGITANDVTFFDEVVPVVQEEPLEAADPETRGLLASHRHPEGQALRARCADARHPGRGRGRRQCHRPRPRLQHPRPGRLLLSEQRVEDALDRRLRLLATRRGAEPRCAGDVLLRSHWRQPGDGA